MALTLVAVLLLVVTVPNLGTVFRAARADGVPGTFTAVRLSCVQHPGHVSCVWSGGFRSDDGTVRRTGVELYGSDRDTHRAGTRTRAVDIGHDTRVYGPGGSAEWLFSALLVGLALTILLTLYAPLLRRPSPRPARRGPGGQEEREAMADRRSASGPGAETIGQ
ncbi:MAG TPA: hypothetical protein VFV66_30725 [Nonomuraea sp.]|nr:hypothetical protein [Nonomuraea sp.]